MSERTKGRLAVCPADESVICDADGRVIAEVLSEHQAIEEDAATCRHLVAAWNACEDLGLTTEQLEAGVLREMVAALRDVETWLVLNRRDGSVIAPRVRGVLAKIGGKQ